MALRKLKKSLKPVIWVITVLFVASLFVIGSAGAFGGKGNNPNGVAVKVKVKGEMFSQKIIAKDLERAFNGAIEKYRNYYKNVDEEYIKMMVFNEMIEQKILIQNAKKYKVAVTEKEIEEEFKKQTAGIDPEQLKMMLRYQRTTKSELEDGIKETLTAQKVRDKIMSEYKATPEDVKNYFEENKYSQYKDKEFKDVEAKVKEEVTNVNKNKVYKKWMETEVGNSKIVVKQDAYKAYQKTTAYKIGKYEISNVALRTKIFMGTLFSQEKKDSKKAEADAIEELKKEAAIAEAAEAAGIKLDANTDSESQFIYFKEKYFNYIKKNYKYTDADLMAYFNIEKDVAGKKESNKDKYNQKESIDAQIIYMALKVSEDDKKEAKTKAEKLLNDIKAGQDFATLAKANSDDPGSKVNGGELGFFSKGQMVPAFEKAAFEGKVGEVYPTIIETQFGYHIIKVEEKKADGSQVRASHILIKTAPSEKTKAALKTKAEAVIAEINSGKKKMEDAVKANSEIEKKDTFTTIYKDGSIDGVSDSKEVIDALYASKENELKGTESANGYYITKVVKHVAAKSPSFEEVKGAVTTDFLNEKASTEVEKVGKENGAKIKAIPEAGIIKK